MSFVQPRKFFLLKNILMAGGSSRSTTLLPLCVKHLVHIIVLLLLQAHYLDFKLELFSLHKIRQGP